MFSQGLEARTSSGHSKSVAFNFNSSVLPLQTFMAFHALRLVMLGAGNRQESQRTVWDCKWLSAPATQGRRVLLQYCQLSLHHLGP